MTSWIKSISVFLVILLLVNTSSVFAKGNVDLANYTGEELFKGIVLGEGEVAKLFPEIWSKEMLELTSTPEAQESINTILIEIKDKEPTFFEEFREAVYSGNHLHIQEVLSNTVTILEALLEENFNLDEMAAENTGSAEGRSIVAILAVAITTVVVYSHGAIVTMGGVAAAYLYVIGGKDVPWSSALQQESELQKELMIDLVATTFSK